MPALDWNKNISGNKVQVHPGWANYLDETDNWKPIDCIIKDTGSQFEVTEAPFKCTMPKLSGGIATFESNNRYDIFKKEKITADPFIMQIKALAIDENVDGELFDINGDGRLDAVIYRNAYPDINADLIYYVKHGIAPRLEKLIRFNTALGADFKPKFWLKYDKQAEISPRDFNHFPAHVDNRKKARDHARGLINSPQPLNHKEGFYIRAWDEPQKRGIGIKTPLVYDSNGKVEEVAMTISRYGAAPNNEYELEKTIVESFFNNAVLPVYSDAAFTFFPEADPATKAGDGYVARQVGGVWDDMRNGDGTVSNNLAATIEAGHRYLTFPDFFELWRGFLSYDISSIVGTIISGSLQPYVTDISKEPLSTPYYTFMKGNPIDPASLVALDYQNVTFTDLTNRIASDDLIVSARNIFDLNAQGIAEANVGGIVTYVATTGDDVDDVEPTPYGGNFKRDRLRIASAETANKPILELIVSDKTTVGDATAVDGGNHNILVSMPYTDDPNNNSTYTIDYKLSSDEDWINWITDAANTPSPYLDTITGILGGKTYDVRVTYNDVDGVIGTNPQIISGIPVAALQVQKAFFDDLVRIVPFRDK